MTTELRNKIIDFCDKFPEGVTTYPAGQVYYTNYGFKNGDIEEWISSCGTGLRIIGDYNRDQITEKFLEYFK